jgi:Ulp1 family protease
MFFTAARMGFKAPNIEMFESMMTAALWVMPCCVARHWWDFFINIPRKRIEVACSLGQRHTEDAHAVLAWIAQAHQWHTGAKLDVSDWEIWHVAVPLQSDGRSCGIAAWLAAWHRSAGVLLDYDLANRSPFFRQVAALLLLGKRRQSITIVV